MRAAREVALAGLQVVGGRPLLQQGLVVHGGRRPPRPARFRLPLRLELAGTPGRRGGGSRSRSSRAAAAAAAAGLAPLTSRGRVSPQHLPRQSQDPGHVARLPAGVRRGAGPNGVLKGPPHWPLVGFDSVFLPDKLPCPASVAPRPPTARKHFRSPNTHTTVRRLCTGVVIFMGCGPPTHPFLRAETPCGLGIRGPEPTHHGSRS